MAWTACGATFCGDAAMSEGAGATSPVCSPVCSGTGAVRSRRNVKAAIGPSLKSSELASASPTWRSVFFNCFLRSTTSFRIVLRSSSAALTSPEAAVKARAEDICFFIASSFSLFAATTSFSRDSLTWSEFAIISSIFFIRFSILSCNCSITILSKLPWADGAFVSVHGIAVFMLSSMSTCFRRRWMKPSQARVPVVASCMVPISFASPSTCAFCSVADRNSLSPCVWLTIFSCNLAFAAWNTRASSASWTLCVFISPCNLASFAAAPSASTSRSEIFCWISLVATRAVSMAFSSLASVVPKMSAIASITLSWNGWRSSRTTPRLCATASVKVWRAVSGSSESLRPSMTCLHLASTGLVRPFFARLGAASEASSRFGAMWGRKGAVAAATQTKTLT
mmetsp:Transcript_111945/g.316393  ORF Transcript_111945/g.316393 Transcript_111945/m.316393 type:complete len:396 (-) Transcript_111945:7-1194(-)